MAEDEEVYCILCDSADEIYGESKIRRSVLLEMNLAFASYRSDLRWCEGITRGVKEIHKEIKHDKGEPL